MQYFIGIVPPPEYSAKILQFQNHWPSNCLSQIVEPHITVKSQGGLYSDLDWMQYVKKACSTFTKFELSLTSPIFLGDSVIGLGVQSQQLLELHRSLVKAVSPPPELITRYFELDSYLPHLTLGQTRWGMKDTELLEMEALAKTELTPFPVWTVTHLRVYAEIQPDRYVPYDDIALG
ncbi:2'-5' RNA ligase family protein [Paenibacillus sp. FSL K6-1096]|uniref:2'-5' RNA ligase family protein n=1 Tax=Paenibacillus sp. FSL K6-1096 TaxID=2921460 RepID=UPI0030EF697C